MRDFFVKRLSSGILGILMTTFLSACAGPKVMPSIVCKQPITCSTSGKAYLHWTMGKQYLGHIEEPPPTYTHYHGSPAAGLMAELIVSAAKASYKAMNPSQYLLSYGKPEQAIFMTSLKKALETHQIFKEVEFTTQSNLVDKKAALISLDFKMTRVSPRRATEYDPRRIILDVHMTIRGGGKPVFQRVYLVENEPKFSGDFTERQTEVSTKLMEKITSGIQQWCQGETS